MNYSTEKDRQKRESRNDFVIIGKVGEDTDEAPNEITVFDQEIKNKHHNQVIERDISSSLSKYTE